MRIERVDKPTTFFFSFHNLFLKKTGAGGNVILNTNVTDESPVPAVETGRDD